MSRSAGAYHHGNLRAALVEAALELLETNKGAELSLREVARRAGVSHNAPYHHFSDRAGLLAAAAEEAMRQFVEAQASAYASGSSPWEAAVDMGEAYVAWAVAHPGAFDVIYDPRICSPGSPSAGMAPLIERNEQLVAQAVFAAYPDVDSSVAEALAIGLWGAVHGLAQLVIAGHFPAESVGPALSSLLTTAAHQA